MVTYNILVFYCTTHFQLLSCTVMQCNANDSRLLVNQLFPYLFDALPFMQSASWITSDVLNWPASITPSAWVLWVLLLRTTNVFLGVQGHSCWSLLFPIGSKPNMYMKYTVARFYVCVLHRHLRSTGFCFCTSELQVFVFVCCICTSGPHVVGFWILHLHFRAASFSFHIFFF